MKSGTNPELEGLGPEGEHQRCVRALEAAFREHQQVLLAWLRQKLGTREDADDIIQQTLMRATAYGQKNRIENPKALLFKIAANLVINEYKRRNRENSRLVSLDADHIQPDLAGKLSNGDTPENDLVHKQRLALLKRVVDEMPERQRRAFILNRFEGLTYKEIARAMGVSESTIEKDFMNALKKLRAAGEEDGDRVVSFPKSRRKRR